MVINQKGDTMIGLGNYEKCSEEDVKQDIINSYYADKDLVNKFEILIAVNDNYDYEESSFFLLREKATGKLFENHGGHCSCSGYEEQFDPKETTLAYLKSDNFYASPGGATEAVKKLVADW